MVFLRRTTSRCPRPTKVDVATDCGTQPWWPGPAKGCQGWGRISHAACRRCEKPPPKWAHTLCNAHASERSDTAAESNHDKVTEPYQSPSQRAKERCADLSAEHSDDDTNSPTSDCEGDAGERAAVAADAGVGDGSKGPALKSRIAAVRTALEALSEAGLVATPGYRQTRSAAPASAPEAATSPYAAVQAKQGLGNAKKARVAIEQQLAASACDLEEAKERQRKPRE